VPKPEAVKPKVSVTVSAVELAALQSSGKPIKPEPVPVAADVEAVA
jgi:hypothetical protein